MAVITFLLSVLLYACDPGCIDSCVSGEENCYWLCRCWNKPSMNFNRKCDLDCKNGCGGNLDQYTECVQICGCTKDGYGLELVELGSIWETQTGDSEEISQKKKKDEKICKERCGQLCKVSKETEGCEENCFYDFCQDDIQGLDDQLKQFNQMLLEKSRNEGIESGKKQESFSKFPLVWIGILGLLGLGVAYTQRFFKNQKQKVPLDREESPYIRLKNTQ